MKTETMKELLNKFLSKDNPHLTDAEADLIRKISECVIIHDALRQAHATVENAIDENQAHSEPRHALVLGDAGCGKTTLRDLIHAQMPEPEPDTTFKLGIHRHQPLLSLSVPASITPRLLAIHLLAELGDKTSKHGTCYELTERLKFYIRANRVRVVWLDEFQHLLALGRGGKRGASCRLMEACNWIKSIINDTSVSFVLMGTRGTMQLLDYDDQLLRRFTHLSTSLAPFKPPAPDTTELVDFVDELMLSCLDVLPQFDSAEWLKDRPVDAMRLWVATEGVPSRIKDLLIRAALIAHRENARLITMTHFTTAFAQTRQQRLDFEIEQARREQQKNLIQALELKSLNPFAANDTVINQLARKMAA